MELRGHGELLIPLLGCKGRRTLCKPPLPIRGILYYGEARVLVEENEVIDDLMRLCPTVQFNM